MTLVVPISGTMKSLTQRSYSFAALNSLDGLDLEGHRINPAFRFARSLQHSLPLLRLTVTDLACLSYGVQSITLGKEIQGSSRHDFEWHCVKQNKSIGILEQFRARRRIPVSAIMAKQ
jgi:hypothetical protein